MAISNIGKTVTKLSVLAISMFVFAIYILPPIYDVFCEITGLNGKGQTTAAEVQVVEVDESREIRVTFIATNNEQMPWEFKPNDAVMIVKPGEKVNTSFFAKNTTEKMMVSRAIPSFVPSTSAPYFHKIECFCFDNQPLEAGESANMNLQFYVDPELPKSIKNITASYTIFDITDVVEENEMSQR
ncbi:MAG: cytochrome c oxidase assembly protein [Cellvibrionaceae bacterium]